MEEHRGTPKKDPEVRTRRRNRRIAVYGGLIAAVVGFYFYQPQRINFKPARLPANNPKVDPDSKRLFSKGVKIAIVQGHPDDSEFYLGPLLLRLAKCGAEIHQLVMTDGDKGFYFWSRGRSGNISRIRELEQREASRHYAREVTFLHLPDGRLARQAGNARRVRDYLNRIQPDYVLGFDPKHWPKVSHSDHLAAGEAAWTAVTEEPGVDSVRYMLLYHSAAPNFVPDVTDHIEQAQELLTVHKSQFFGERLDRVRNMVLNGWYEAGQSVGIEFGVPLRAVKLR